MPSIQELNDLSIKGDVGKLLVHAFSGEVGFTFPRADSTFQVGFSSREAVPEIEAVEKVIRKHYEMLGYSVTSEISPNECLDIKVVVPHTPSQMFHILVIRNWNEAVQKDNLHVKSQIIC